MQTDQDLIFEQYTNVLNEEIPHPELPPLSDDQQELGSYTKGPIQLRVVYSPEWDEYSVEWWENGERNEDKTYYTGDEGDAVETAGVMINHLKMEDEEFGVESSEPMESEDAENCKYSNEEMPILPEIPEIEDQEIHAYNIKDSMQEIGTTIEDIITSVNDQYSEFMAPGVKYGFLKALRSAIDINGQDFDLSTYINKIEEMDNLD